jgi:hypothetical protein
MTPDEVMKSIRSADIEFDQAIREFDRWTHISIPTEGVAPRKTALIIDKTGTRAYA